MFSFRTSSLSRCPSSRLLRRWHIRSLIGFLGLSPLRWPIGSSTAPSISAEVYLRVVSGGTSYRRFRLVYRPYTRVRRVICTSTSLRSSTLHYRASTCPGIDQPASGLTPVTPRDHTGPLVSCGLSLSLRLPCVNLATDVNSLARFSKRITEHRSRCSFHAL